MSPSRIGIHMFTIYYSSMKVHILNKFYASFKTINLYQWEPCNITAYYYIIMININDMQI